MKDYDIHGLPSPNEKFVQDQKPDVKSERNNEEKEKKYRD